MASKKESGWRGGVKHLRHEKRHTATSAKRYGYRICSITQMEYKSYAILRNKYGVIQFNFHESTFFK